jgi:hypothetical protein
LKVNQKKPGKREREKRKREKRGRGITKNKKAKKRLVVLVPPHFHLPPEITTNFNSRYVSDLLF